MQKLNLKISGIQEIPVNDIVIGYKPNILYLKMTILLLGLVFCAFPEYKSKITHQLNSSAPLSSRKLIKTGDTTGNIWYNKFVKYEASEGGRYFNSSNASILGWDESYMLRCYVKMYESTQNTKWLTKLTIHADAIIGHATADGDGFSDWKTPNFRAKGDTKSYPYLILDALITLPIAQFVRIVHQNPVVLASFTAKANAYRKFIETQVVPKWETNTSYVGNCWVQVDANSGYFKEPATINSLPSALFDPLPYNMMASYAQMLWTLYDVNGNTGYRDKANQMAQYFKNGIRPNGTGYAWWYCNIGLHHMEDTSHGNLDVEFALESFNRGGTFTGTDIQGLSNTLTNIMWNQSTTVPLLTDNIDGTGTKYNKTKALTGWIQLTQCTAAAWTIAAEQLRHITISSYNQAFTLTQLIAWDPVKLQNQGFEYKSTSDSTLPACWFRLGSASDITRYTAEKYSGEACAAIKSTAGRTTRQGLYQDWTQWEPNTTYEVSFKVKTTGKAGASVFIYNTTTNTVGGTTHNYNSVDWSAQSFTFTTPTAGPALRLYLENRDQNKGGTAFFDNVVIKKQGEEF